MSRIGQFGRDRTGNFGILLAMMSVPLLIGVGLSIDYSSALQARTHMQAIADGAALALVASRENDQAKLQALAQRHVAANFTPMLDSIELTEVRIAGTEVTVGLAGKMPTSFMGLANIPQVDITSRAVAERAVAGSIEVALVLDNTWSMSETDTKGVQKIVALREASKSLVNELFGAGNTNVRIGVVPYADYVNVGTYNRNASWMSVPADKVSRSEEKCTETSSEYICTQWAPSYSCGTTVTDGVTSTRTCGGECTQGYTQTYSPPKQTCWPASTTTQTWFGCAGSRKIDSVRLSDGDASVTYPGLIATYQQCPAQILPLTSTKASVLAAIEKMAPNNGSYKPSTYIPAGLIWGLNLLSPAAPFSEGASYDASNNKAPRKVVVLMTDGENTLRYHAPNIGQDSSTGTHVDFSNNTTKADRELQQSNSDGVQICTNMKSRDRSIEIFSVALGVKDDAARKMLQDCASNTAGTLDHYYDATDATTLSAAFAGIAAKLSQVRLTR